MSHRILFVGRCRGMGGAPTLMLMMIPQPQQGRKVFTLQTLPARDEPFDDGVGKVAGFSRHAGVAARADQRQKLKRLCRHISWPAVAEKRLSLTPNGNLRYQLKTP